MNSCILIVRIIKEPELRYTADAQIPVAEMMVEFPNIGVDNKPAILKVVAWRDLAQQVSQQYHEGDVVIVEGRLNMNTIDRPEGFKEKRAELTASRFYPAGVEAMGQEPAQMSTISSRGSLGKQQPQDRDYGDNVVALESRRSSTVKQKPKPSQSEAEMPSQDSEGPGDYDPIPF
ncbi:MAG: single-stranded DNA-binding protein [Microcoleaceae cyanobacterium MO_207.B10]|nr:single-stranded DNA-binding protein [Microcoleaceae cyanobacterium MO_207.B10]